MKHILMLFLILFFSIQLSAQSNVIVEQDTLNNHFVIKESVDEDLITYDTASALNELYRIGHSKYRAIGTFYLQMLKADRAARESEQGIQQVLSDTSYLKMTRSRFASQFLGDYSIQVGSSAVENISVTDDLTVIHTGGNGRLHIYAGNYIKITSLELFGETVYFSLDTSRRSPRWFGEKNNRDRVILKRTK